MGRSIHRSPARSGATATGRATGLASVLREVGTVAVVWDWGAAPLDDVHPARTPVANATRAIAAGLARGFTGTSSLLGIAARAHPWPGADGAGSALHVGGVFPRVPRNTATGKASRCRHRPAKQVSAGSAPHKATQRGLP